MKKLNPINIIITSLLLLMQLVGDISAQNKMTMLAKSRYSDPNGYFKIVPPDSWRIQKYPQDPRGKVAFIGPDNVQLRVLVKGLNYNSFDEMFEEIKGIEKKIGTNTNIELITFSGKQAVKRTFIVKGTKMLFIDFMIGNTTHNLMYSASSGKYEKYQSLVQESINTYEPTLDGVSPENVKKHAIAKSLRLSQIFIEQQNYNLALEFINEGLDIEPNNTNLLELKKKIIGVKQPTKNLISAQAAVKLSTAKAPIQETTNPLHFSIAKIKPIGKATSLKPSHHLQPGGEIKSSIPNSSKKYITKLTGSFVTPSNAIILGGIGDMVVGKSGTELLKQLESSKPIISSSLIITKVKDGFVLSTTNKIDKLYFSVNTNSGANLIFPAGTGTQFLFKGKVVDFFEGYTFDGDIKDPLCFQLLKDSGLTYISGCGQVLKDKNILVEFSKKSSALNSEQKSNAETDQLKSNEIKHPDNLLNIEKPDNEIVNKEEKIYNFFEVAEKPVILYKEKPFYSKRARKSGIKGTVVIEVIIGKNGEVEAAKIFKSIPELDSAALQAAKKCKFKPAKQNNKIVKVKMNIPFKFKL